MEYKCHSLQLIKTYGEKTNAHHDTINKKNKNKYFDSHPKYVLLEQVQYIGHNLKEYSKQGIQPKNSYAMDFPSP